MCVKRILILPVIDHHVVACNRRQAFGHPLCLLFLQSREIRVLSLVRTLHCGRILLLVVCGADYSAVSRGEHIRAISIIIVELCTVAFVAESILTDFRNIECKLFWNGPAMSCVKRS